MSTTLEIGKALIALLLSGSVAFFLGKMMERNKYLAERAKLLEDFHRLEKKIDDQANTKVKEILNQPKPPHTPEAIDEFLKRSKEKWG